MSSFSRHRTESQLTRHHMSGGGSERHSAADTRLLYEEARQGTRRTIIGATAYIPTSGRALVRTSVTSLLEPTVSHEMASRARFVLHAPSSQMRRQS